MNVSRRTVVEIRADLHQRIKQLALLNDLRIYELANAIIEDTLSDKEKVKALIKRLKLK
ncbi:MAG: hypothetical protein QXV09_02690 [Candidatus Bathyarchaeia archaeon]